MCSWLDLAEHHCSLNTTSRVGRAEVASMHKAVLGRYLLWYGGLGWLVGSGALGFWVWGSVSPVVESESTHNCAPEAVRHSLVPLEACFVGGYCSRPRTVSPDAFAVAADVGCEKRNSLGCEFVWLLGGASEQRCSANHWFGGLPRKAWLENTLELLGAQQPHTGTCPHLCVSLLWHHAVLCAAPCTGRHSGLNRRVC